MKISTTDPITHNDVSDPEEHPFIIEGEGEDVVKIYFENEANKAIYLDIKIEESSTNRG